MTDLKNNTEYWASNIGVYEIKKGWFVSDLFPAWETAFLLETKWNKPDPWRVSRIKSGTKSLDVVETRINGRRQDFVFDPEDLIVSQVRFYDENKRLYLTHFYSDYRELDGIQMPRTWKRTFVRKTNPVWPEVTAKLIRIDFSFNVEYDPALFTRPPKTMSKNDWKPKNKGK